MNIPEILLLAVALSMDAFAVSISEGLSINLKKREAVFTALSFGIFQGLMPTVGFFTGISFKNIINSFDHWIAFLLLAFIGGKMLFDVVKEQHSNEPIEKSHFSFKKLFILSIATSIDALAAGIGLAMVETNILIPALLICTVTFICSLFGIIFGKKIGSFFYHKAQILGGIVLIAIGAKILFEHLLG